MKQLSLFLTYFLLLLLPLISSAQDKVPHIARVEGDVHIGLTFAVCDYGFLNNGQGLNLGAEVRYNFQKLPMDIGLGFEGSTLLRWPSKNNGYYPFRNESIYVSTDYIFRQMKKVSFFAGVGLGYTFFNSRVSGPITFSTDDKTDPERDVQEYTSRPGSFLAMPRIGVEFWHRLRISCCYMIQEKTNQRFAVSITCAIGGGVRK